MRISAGISFSPGRNPRRMGMALLCLLFLGFLIACSPGYRFRDSDTKGYMIASWYGPDFHGKLTASGERYDMDAMTCAHKSLPFGTRLEVTSMETGRSAIVTVTDRGPFVDGRDLDLSRGAARKIGLLEAGVSPISVVRLGRDERYKKYLVDLSPVGRMPGPYTIQLGAFAELDNAAHLRKSLELTHEEVYMVEKWKDGKRLYRVRIGRFDSELTARAMAETLADEGYEVMLAPYEG